VGFFPAFGTPGCIVTDNARVFCCKAFKDLCFRWGIHHVTTTPYYPQGSLAERVNRNLKSALKIFHHKAQLTWDEDLPWLSMAFNSAVHDSTKITTDKLFLGRDLGCPLGVQWKLAPEIIGEGSDEKTRLFWTRAYANLQRARRAVARRFNKDRKPHSFQVGDTVRYRLKLKSDKANRTSAKLLLRWSEPLVISEVVRPNVVLLANPDTGVVVRRAHVTQLKPSTK
jgi:hypothetical protein